MTDYNLADEQTKLVCVTCKSTDSFSISRKLMGGSDDRIYLKCEKCGTHCSLHIMTRFELSQNWWR